MTKTQEARAMTQMHGVSLTEALAVNGTATQIGHAIGFTCDVEQADDVYAVTLSSDSEIIWREEGVETLAEVQAMTDAALGTFLPDDWWPFNAEHETIGYVMLPDGSRQWNVPQQIVFLDDYRQEKR
jgi:hypothetical protein